MQETGLLRLLAAMFYDSLLLAALLFFATALLLPFNGGEAFNSKQLFYTFYLLSVSFIYFGWFWTKGGQTPGLKAWKICLVSDNDQRITWKQAFIRFLAAFVSWSCLGAGFVWILVDKSHRSWHDRISKSSLQRQTGLKQVA